MRAIELTIDYFAQAAIAYNRFQDALGGILDPVPLTPPVIEIVLLDTDVVDPTSDYFTSIITPLGAINDMAGYLRSMYILSGSYPDDEALKTYINEKLPFIQTIFDFFDTLDVDGDLFREIYSGEYSLDVHESVKEFLIKLADLPNVDELVRSEIPFAILPEAAITVENPTDLTSILEVLADLTQRISQLELLTSDFVTDIGAINTAINDCQAKWMV